MKNLVILIFVLIILQSCTSPNRPIAKEQDYNEYLYPSETLLVKNDGIIFWESRLGEIPNDETSQLKLASLYAEHFGTTGEIEFLQQSDSLYQLVLHKTVLGKSEIYLALSANAVTQHQFQQAKSYLEKALAEGGSKAGAHLMMVDVLLETGDEYGAKHYLRQLSNKNSFAYLIREAKVKDHEGKLDTAILLMEKAYLRIQNNKALSCWTLSNLGDMYGHAGKIQDAYDNYLEVLKIDSHYDYALKGIANILYSHDHNTVEAKKIITVLANRKRMPEAHLILANLEKYEGNMQEEKAHLEAFRNEVTQPDYKGMYNSYMAELNAEYFGNPNGTIALAIEEIKNRPTAKSYDLLAWGYYHLGETNQALKIAQQRVEGKTFEPVPLYHLAVLYDANGYSEKAKEIFNSLRDSFFELGPEKAKVIRQKLS